MQKENLTFLKLDSDLSYEEDPHCYFFENKRLKEASEERTFRPKVLSRLGPNLVKRSKLGNSMKLKSLFSLGSSNVQTKTTLQQPQQQQPTVKKGTAMISQQDFNQLYTVGPMLGKGGFGTVYAGFRNADQFPVAIKSVSKNRPLILLPPDHKCERERFVPVEVALMMQTSHINGVISLIDYFELPDCFMIIMERMGTSSNSSRACKDLFDFISDSGAIKEDMAKYIFQQIVQTIVQVHTAGVVHRDIKDENILIDTRTYKVKLIDFGSGAKLHNEVYSDFDGTRVYAPPEWIKFRRYRADGLTVWSLGILLYDMLFGDIPFETDSQIKRANIYFRDALNISEEAKDLIRACLTVVPKDRLSLAQLAEHPWLKTKAESEQQKDRPVLMRTISAPVNVISSSNNNYTNAAQDNNNPEAQMKQADTLSRMETVDANAATATSSCGGSAFASPNITSPVESHPSFQSMPKDVSTMFNSTQFLPISPAVAAGRQMLPKVSCSDEDEDSFYSDDLNPLSVPFSAASNSTATPMSISPIPYRDSHHLIVPSPMANTSLETYSSCSSRADSCYSLKSTDDDQMMVTDDERYHLQPSASLNILQQQQQGPLPSFHELKSLKLMM